MRHSLALFLLLSACGGVDPIDTADTAPPVEPPRPRALNEGSLRFDRAQWVQVPGTDRVGQQSPFTLQAWFKVDKLTDQQVVFVRDGALRFGPKSNRLRLGVNEGDCETETDFRAIDNDVWTHVAVVSDGPEARLYLDGHLLGRSVHCEPESNLNALFFGANSDGGRALRGSIDEVQLWGRTLSPIEVQEGRFRRLYGDEPELLGYWAFEQAEGQQVLDSGPLGQHGTLGFTEAVEESDPARQGDVPFTGDGSDELDLIPHATPTPTENTRGIRFKDESWLTLPGRYGLGQQTDLTVAFWVKPVASIQVQSIFSHAVEGDDMSLGFSLKTGWTLRMNGGPSCEITGDASTLPDDVWTHVAITSAQGQPTTVYLNGAASGTAPSFCTVKPSDNEIVIGARWGTAGFSEFFTGELDELRIWSGVRTAQQIQEGYRSLIRGDEPGLLGYWDFEEVHDGVVEDHSDSGFHAYLGRRVGADPNDPSQSAGPAF